VTAAADGPLTGAGGVKDDAGRRSPTTPTDTCAACTDLTTGARAAETSRPDAAIAATAGPTGTPPVPVGAVADAGEASGTNDAENPTLATSPMSVRRTTERGERETPLLGRV
jgi:hypothetical protein